jgi:outer membrane protein TolC
MSPEFKRGQTPCIYRNSVVFSYLFLLLAPFTLHGNHLESTDLDQHMVISLSIESSLELSESDYKLYRNQEKLSVDQQWRFNPILEVEGGFDSEGRHPDYSFYLKQDIDRTQKPRIELAKSVLNKNKKSRVLIRRDAIAKGLAYYFDALYTGQLKELAEKSLEHSLKVWEVSKMKKDAGEIGGLDLNLAKIALGKSRTTLSKVEALLSEKLLKLTQHLLLPDHKKINLRGELEWTFSENNLSTLFDIKSHPLLNYYRAALEEAKANYNKTNSSYQSKLGLGLGLESEGDEDKAILSFEIQFGASGRSHAMNASASRIAEQEMKLDRIRKKLPIEVETALSKYRQLKKATGTFAEETLSLIQENESAVNKRYKAGDLPLTQLLSIRREILEAKEEFLSLQYEEVMAAMNLSKLAYLSPFNPQANTEKE